MLATIRGLLEGGRNSGFPLTRIVAHAEAVLDDWSGTLEFVKYESELNIVLG
jgi:hypothetical protein